jgi:hypothetical protein
LIFAGVKNKWNRRVYIDLYAGAAFSRIHSTDIRPKGSPMLALGGRQRPVLPLPAALAVMVRLDTQQAARFLSF